MKLKPFSLQGDLLGYLFWCPGCREAHPYNIKGGRWGSGWSFNGDLDRPTFTPSLLMRTGHHAPGTKPEECWCTYNAAHPEDAAPFTCSICHLFLTDGQLQFCSDSTHDLAGKTVPLPDWPEGE